MRSLLDSGRRLGASTFVAVAVHRRRALGRLGGGEEGGEEGHDIKYGGWEVCI